MTKLDGKRIKRGTTPKVKERIGRIFDGIQEGKTELQIAQEEGVSDRQIRYDIRKPEFQMRMNAMLTELSRKVPEWIQALHDSDDPLDRRTAATLGMQLLKSKIPHQSEVFKVDVKIDQRSTEFKQILESLSPEEQAPFIAAYRERQVPRFVESESTVIDIIPEEEEGEENKDG